MSKIDEPLSYRRSICLDERKEIKLWRLPNLIAYPLSQSLAARRRRGEAAALEGSAEEIATFEDQATVPGIYLNSKKSAFPSLYKLIEAIQLPIQPLMEAIQLPIQLIER